MRYILILFIIFMGMPHERVEAFASRPPGKQETSKESEQIKKQEETLARYKRLLKEAEGICPEGFALHPESGECRQVALPTCPEGYIPQPNGTCRRPVKPASCPPGYEPHEQGNCVAVQRTPRIRKQDSESEYDTSGLQSVAPLDG